MTRKTTLPAILAEAEFDERLIFRVWWSATRLLFALLMFTYAFRGNREFLSVLAGGVLTLMNFAGLERLVRELLDPEKARARKGMGSLRPAGLFFAKTAVLVAGLIVVMVVYPVQPVWLIAGMSVVVIAVFQELATLYRRVVSDASATATTEPYVQRP